MKNILVLVHDDIGQDSRLEAAFDLTHAIGGHLMCLDVAIPPSMPPDALLYGDIMLAAAEAETQHGTKIRARVEATELPFTWVNRSSSLKTAIRETSALADIVVLSTPKGIAWPDMRGAIGEALTQADKAVLAVPLHVRPLNLRGKMVIAWDGSPQVTAALHAAMPLLRQASRVEIVEVDDGSLGAPAEEAAAHLRQHDVAAHVCTEEAFGEKAAFVLLDQIARLKPSLVVMGGFGHSRLVERVFGGVTQRLLDDSPVPLFLKN